MVKIQVEVDTLAQLETLIPLKVDAVMLDNMDEATMRRAVAMVAGCMLVEASGGITPETVAKVAATGVDLISSGALTHSVKALDLGLDFEAA
jgi:nicotinate-nucleotide pyrophosphorylase (carboxylating)